MITSVKLKKLFVRFLLKSTGQSQVKMEDIFLMHSVGNLPFNSEINTTLTYADYYFLEALLRYKQWVLNKK